MSLHLLKRPSVLFFFSILFCTVRFLWTLKALVWVGLRQCDVWRFNSAFPQQSPPVQTLQSTNSPLGLSSVSTCLNVTRTQCHLISPPLPPQASSVKVPNCTRGGGVYGPSGGFVSRQCWTERCWQRNPTVNTGLMILELTRRWVLL